MRTVPLSLFAALAVVAVLYVGVQIVCVGLLPDLAGTDRPLAAAADTALGPAAARVMVVGALLSTLGVAHTIVLAAARLPFAMAEQGQLPAALAAVHPRYRTPHVSLVLSTACMLAFTLVTTFTTAVTLTVGFRVLVYLITCAALPALRRRAAGPRAAFRLPAGDVIAAAGVLLCVTLLAFRPWKETSQLLLAVAAGFVIYFLARPGRRLEAIDG